MKINKSKQTKFLFISSSDLYGGASIMGYNLHSALLKAGHISTMVVSRKFSSDDSVVEINGKVKYFFQNCISGGINFLFSYRIGKLVRRVYNLFYKILKSTGREVFYYPESRKIISILNYKPDIIHLHNIYPDYFDINLLKEWHEDYKLVITLHDFWIFTGHCGLPLDCNKWLENCGNCPHLDYAPSVPIDKTSQNKKFKNNYFQSLKINYIYPSKWSRNEIQRLGKEVNQIGIHRIIKNAIDTKIFKPGNKHNNRKNFDLPLSDFIIMVCAAGFKYNYCKDIETVLASFNRIKCDHKGSVSSKKISLMIVGEKSENYKDYVKEDIFFMGSYMYGQQLASLYQSADIFVHSSPMETWGLTTSESLSTGLPVLATYVGGLKEQVRGYCIDKTDNNMKRMNNYSIEEANGIMFERGNVDMLSRSIKFIYQNQDIYNSLSNNARNYAEYHLSINSRIKDYMKYYSELK